MNRLISACLSALMLCALTGSFCVAQGLQAGPSGAQDAPARRLGEEALPGAAANPDPPAPSRRMPSHCIALSQWTPGQGYPGLETLHHASWRDPVASDSLRLRYLDHAMFLLQSAGGVSAITDYNGLYNGQIATSGPRPDLVTMNQAHASHYTRDIPEGTQALRGWSTQFGIAAQHDLEIGDLRIRNVPTAIRSFGTVEENGNSIFVFEVAGLCVGHLGHLHHTPTAAQYAALGRLDVVMAAVDGSMTINQGEMVDILKRLRSSVVIPMHWFGEATLQRFLAGMQQDFEIVRPGESEVTLSLRGLPQRPTILVLEPGGLD